MLTIEQALDEAYKNAGSNAYFGNGFRAGVEFAQRWINIEKELPKIDESGESDLILMKIDHFVYVGNYTEDGEWVELITGEKYIPTHWRPIELK